MKVVWASDRVWTGTGGAERADRSMLSRKPDDVEVHIVAPGFSEQEGAVDAVKDAERVVVSGVLKFPKHESALLASKRPLVWAHDLDSNGHPIHGYASDLVLLTPMHLMIEREALYVAPGWSTPNLHLCPGWFDTSPWDSPLYEVPAPERGKTALFAHRYSWSKNLQGATKWAQDHDIDLRVMMARPYEDVLQAMAEVRYFVLLSHIVDPGPWSVIEAQLSGCELVVNELVGWYNMPRENLRQAIDAQDEVFWNLVTGGA